MAVDQGKFQDVMNRGHSASWDQMWEQAAQYYREALKISPDHPMALSSLGLTLVEMNRFSEALECYKKASDISPQDPVLHEKCARIYQRQGKIEEAINASMQAAELYCKNGSGQKAIENLIELLGLKPDHLVARSQLAMIYEQLGRKDQAANEYLEAVSISQRTGDTKKAEETVEYVLQMIPEYPPAVEAQTLLMNGLMLQEPRRPRGGTGTIRMAQVREMDESAEIGEDTNDPVTEARQRALVALASLLFDQNPHETEDNKPAARRFTGGLRGTGRLLMSNSNKDKVILHVGQAIEAQTHGNEDLAIAELEKAFGDGLDDLAADFDIGLLYMLNGNKKAVKHLQKSMRHDEYALASYLLLGQIYRKENDCKQAVSCFLTALRFADIETAPEEQRAELMRRYEPIIEVFGKKNAEEELMTLCSSLANLMLRPAWRDYLNMARKQLSLQEVGDRVIPLAEVLIETSSEDVLKSLAEIRQLIDQDYYYSALEEAYTAIQKSPMFLPLHIQVGEVMMRRGDSQDAVKKFLHVADLYDLRGETEQAIQVLQRVNEAAPMMIGVQDKLISLMVERESYEEAVDLYKKMAADYYQLAQTEKAHKAYQDALQLVQKHKLPSSRNVEILYQMADIDMQILNIRQAILHYEQIRTLEPQDMLARSKLIELNFRMGQDAKAISELDNAIATLEENGERHLAIELVKELIAGGKTHNELYKHLAVLYGEDGRINEAVDQLEILANEMLTNGDENGAANIFRTIISMNPPNVEKYKASLDQLKKM